MPVIMPNSRDNDEIIALLSDAQKYHRSLLSHLIEADAPPEMLRAVVDAMERLSLSNQMGFDGYDSYPRFHITEEIEGLAMKLTSLIIEAKELGKGEGSP